MSWRAGRDERGFTLIEVLVALTLMTVLATIVTRAIGTTTLTIGRGDERITEIIAASDLQMVLERELGRARPYLRGTGTTAQPVFAGTPEAVEFAVVRPEGMGAPSLWRVRIAAEPEVDHERLVLREAPLSVTAPGPFAGSERVDDTVPADLLSAGAFYRFRYFGSIADNEARGWHDAWPATRQAPPEGIGLRIVDAAGTPLPGTVEIVLAFPVQASELCGDEGEACRLGDGR